MDYSSLAIWLAILTLGLLVAEFFIPSAGMLTIFSLISAVVSVWSGYHAWWDHSPVVWWIYIICFVSSVPTTIAGAVIVLPKTSFGRRLLPDPPSADESRPYSKEREKLLELVGSIGETATLHAPGGMTLVDGRRYHSESDGLMLEPSTKVKVIRVNGTRIVISPADENITDQSNIQSVSDETNSDAPERLNEEKLDFPFPDE
ncbi:MAG: NfeD family protein [Planctomycetaceae bacterium]|jgi:membrane-bound ClpP family serine protease|nr:NfeD family protein [Planctomycetaceae bacterium]